MINNRNYNNSLSTNQKSNLKSLQDSVNVLNVQKDINEALYNTNDILTKISTHKSSNINYDSTTDKKRRFDDFNKEIKDDINSKNSNNRKNSRNNKSQKNLKNIKNKNLSGQLDNQKKFDVKKLYKYPSKKNMDEEEKLKYKNSKYISTKYKDYLHSVNTSKNKINKNRNSKSKKKDKINDLYNELKSNRLNFPNDEALLKDLKRDISCNNRINKRFGQKIRINPVNRERDLSAGNLRDIDNLKKYYKSDINPNISNNLEDNLLKNGFFIGKNNRKISNDKVNSNEGNNDENNDDNTSYNINNSKIDKIMKKYNNMLGKDKNPKINYDYVKKIRGNVEGLYGNNINQDNNIMYNNYAKKNNEINNDEFDDEYDELFHPKKDKGNNDKNHLNTSDYSNSVYNILNNLDNQNNNNVIGYDNYINFGYDDLINSINQPKIKRVNKRKISRVNINKNKNNSKKNSYLNSRVVDESKNRSYVLAPMKGIPITNISFRARMKYFSDKKEKNLEKLLKEKKEEEKQKCTFQPKTGENKLNVIKYENDPFNGNNNNNKKRKVDLNRINNLYLDYKDKQAKIDELTKDYYLKAGISFAPKISDNNNEIKQFKNKIGLIPYLDRFEIYNGNKQYNILERNNEYLQTDI